MRMIPPCVGLVVASLVIPVLAAAQPPLPLRPSLPPLLKLAAEKGDIAYRIKLRPGVPEPGTTLTVEVEVSEILATPDPTFGQRKPIQGAEMSAVLVGPRAGGKKSFVDARRGFDLPDAGTYGFTFTAPKKGIYGLHLGGSTPESGAIDHAVKVTFGVWPIPQESELPPLPKRPPAATRGNIANGKLLCQKLCKTDIDGARPPGSTPRYLASAFAAAKNDEDLLAATVGEQSTKLPPMERIDILFYLRSLHLRVREFFPRAGVVMAKEFTIDEHGRERLADTARIKLTSQTESATVFVVYEGKRNGPVPTIVAFTDRISRDELIKREDKLGYLIFFEVPGEKNAKEMGMALGREPIYPILRLLARDGGGRRSAGYHKVLRSFHGLGKFDDARSLRRGSKSLRTKLTPIYLRAAEFATMYYREEREFSAFDAEFGEETDEPMAAPEVKNKWGPATPARR